MTMNADPTAELSHRRRSPWLRWVLIVAVLVIVGAIAWRRLAPPPAAAPTPAPVVTVAQPVGRQVREWDDYIGRFMPSRTVEVRPRVSGEVTAVLFRDGDLVKKGQLLFTIDRRPFAAALAEARANAASASSTLVLARADRARAERLRGDEALSGGELDALTGRVRAAAASAAAAEARVRSRQLDVDFTEVRAPIAGRISDRRVDAGNQVAGGEGANGTVLTRINALDPIYFSFEGSEALFLKMQRTRRDGRPVSVDIRLQDESGYPHRGTMDFTDNGLDPRSGTIRGRAVVANGDHFLTPGLFGNMRLASGGTVNALLVPDSAIQTDQARKTVLVVARDGTVAAKPVELGPVIDGLRIVRSGLAPQDRVVIGGTQMAMPGGKVTAKPGRIVPEAAPAGAPPVDLPSASATFAGN